MATSRRQRVKLFNASVAECHGGGRWKSSVTVQRVMWCDVFCSVQLVIWTFIIAVVSTSRHCVVLITLSVADESPSTSATMTDSSTSTVRSHWINYYWLARLLNFKRPLLSVDVSVCVCVSANLMLNISETKRFWGLCQIGTLYRKVAYDVSIGDVFDDVTWLYDVILVTLQYSKSSHLETRIRINVRTI